ncbi:hypothetical protein GY21_05745 [Cryobacterium roopkundense]|uniref:Uncharacterized protein n=1 Tax=Cryobacterium roopkundense TaxID=1001240 RepID=A0A099JM72_9MICO|nr:hypothetical protein [Cryobacterium roopkundense]KGJ79291.1 hypothetical protein GY21_05745 [Cryobacterium roopkundense]MBB5643658.1 hypothetical protein [Cryobacterium roopkundense]
MPQFLVVTRPERTSDDIAADRKAANAFFARYMRTNGTTAQRDLDRVIQFYSHDWNLICCAIEASQWSLTHVHDTAARRAAARAERAVANEIPARDGSQLRPYVHATTTKRMHPAGVTPRPVAERLAARAEAELFWHRCHKPSARYRSAVLRDDVPFPRWLILHPGYGPQQDAPEGYAGTLRRPKAQRFVLNKVRPAGISYDRALEIALAALGPTTH